MRIRQNLKMSEVSQIKRRVFTGISYCSLDAQRRILMPREWRLDTDNSNTMFYIVPSSPNIIKVYDQLHYDKFIESFDNLDEYDEEMADAMMMAGSLVSPVTPDKQGRFTLTQALIEHGQLPTDGSKIVLVGAITYGRIITLDTWTKCKGNPMNLRKIDETLSAMKKAQNQKYNVTIAPQQ